MEVRGGGEGWGVRALPAASASCMRLLLSGPLYLCTFISKYKKELSD